MNALRLAALTATILAATACGGRAVPLPAPSPAPGPAPSGATQRYAALPDTTVCVVDRTTDRGLRDLPAKRSENGSVVVLINDQIRPLEEVHPTNLIAGYAGQEPWFTRGQNVSVQSRAYIKYRGERRVPLDQLRRLGEYQGIPLFGPPAETAAAPQAIYVPVRVGCIFQAYLREDVYRQ